MLDPNWEQHSKEYRERRDKALKEKPAEGGKAGQQPGKGKGKEKGKKGKGKGKTRGKTHRTEPDKSRGRPPQR